MPRTAATSTVLDIHKSPGASQRLKMTWLRDHFKLIAAQIRTPIARVAVSLGGDAEMTRLHRAHLEINSPTDVLTFSNAKPDESIDVDIAVCVDEAKRQAESHSHPIEHEILLYI